MNETQILLIVCSISLFASLITMFVTISTHKKTKRIQDQVFMSLLKCERILKTVENVNESYDNLSSETMNALEYIANTIESLSSSNETVLRKMANLQQNAQNNQQKKVYPRPQLASEITQTIKEQITIELSNSKKLKAPSSNYLSKIVQNVSKTYPDVDIEYIASKTIAMVESMGPNQVQ
jgi:hypothetical protein